jgi:hypothetical protein
MVNRIQPSDRPIPAQLPSTVEELDKYRSFGPELTLNDHVEGIYKVLWPNPDFRALLNATGDDESVEGSMGTDNVIAAQMIREHAKENRYEEVSGRKIHAIVRALNVVMKRYNMSRKLRARMLGGEIVPKDSDSDSEG